MLWIRKPSRKIQPVVRVKRRYRESIASLDFPGQLQNGEDNQRSHLARLEFADAVECLDTTPRKSSFGTGTVMERPTSNSSTDKHVIQQPKKLPITVQIERPPRSRTEKTQATLKGGNIVTSFDEHS